MPKCPACNSSSFDAQLNSNRRTFYLVYCCNCDRVIGAIPMITDYQSDIADIKTKLDNIHTKLMYYSN